MSKEALERGWMLFHERKYERAARELENALRTGAEPALAHWRLGYTYRMLGNAALAREHFQRAVELAPENEGSHRELGRQLAYDGDLHRALAHFARALECDSGVALTFYDTGACLAQLGYHDLGLICFTICGVLCQIAGDDIPTGVEHVQYIRTMKHLEKIVGAKRFAEIQTPIYAQFGIGTGPVHTFRIPTDAFETVTRTFVLPPLRQIACI